MKQMLRRQRSTRETSTRAWRAGGQDGADELVDSTGDDYNQLFNEVCGRTAPPTL
jgi:hypothetical protein